MTNKLRKEIILRNQMRDNAEKEMAKIGCHIVNHGIFKGEYPNAVYVGYYSSECGTIDLLKSL